MIESFRTWLRERETAKAAIRPDPPHVTVSLDQLRALSIMSWGAYTALMWFLWQKVLQVSQQQYETLQLTHVAFWVVDLHVYFPLVIGYAFVALLVPYVAKHSIPILVKLSFRTAPVATGLSLFLTVLVSFVLITGTATVGGHAVLESERGAAVAVEQVQQNRAGLQAQIDGISADLNTMMNNQNAYLAQAASVGAAEWERTYIANARASGDSQLGRIERALGAARSADELRARRDALRAQLAQSGTVAAVQSEVVTDRTQMLSGVMDFLNTFWVLLLAVVMDVTCLFVPFIRETLRMKRNAELAMGDQSGWADDAHRIPDMRAEDAIVPQPMDQAKRRKFVDADSGEEIEQTKVKTREHWRTLKRGKRNRVVIPAETLPDETGVPDGGARGGVSGVAGHIGDGAIADAAPSREDLESEGHPDNGPIPAADENNASDQGALGEPEGHAHGLSDGQLISDTHLDLQLTDTDILALADESAQQNETDQLAAVSEEADGDHTKLPNNEGILVAAE